MLILYKTFQKVPVHREKDTHPAPWQPHELCLEGSGPGSGDLGGPGARGSSKMRCAHSAGGRVHRAGVQRAPRSAAGEPLVNAGPLSWGAQVGREVGKQHFEETWVREGMGTD